MDARIDSEELYCLLKADKETEEAYFKLIDIRAARVPLQHITGTQEFMGFEFKVGPEVLIPRQETEILVTEAARTLIDERKSAVHAKAQKRGKLFRMFSSPPEYDVLDLCCGSGAIGISLAKICEDISVTASDVSRKALAMASENARKNRVDIEFVCGDLFAAVKSGDQMDPKADPATGSSGAGGSGRPLWPVRLQGKGSRVQRFDMIVSNPPYVMESERAQMEPNVLDWEPEQALFVPDSDPLRFYRAIALWADGLLKDGGSFSLEINASLAAETAALFTGAAVIQDINGKDRFIVVKK